MAWSAGKMKQIPWSSPSARSCRNRRKGCNFAWEQCKLKNKAKIVRGASPRPISNPKWFDDNSNVGWLRISDVTEQKGRIHHLSQRISKAGQSKTRVITEPHLLLSIAATVGSPVINYVNTGVHDGFLIFLNPTFDKEFMFQWLLMFKPFWNKYGQPGSQVNLNSDIVGNQSVALPTMSEQGRIGDFFSKLDTAITLHEEKKQQLERLKSALSQKLFANKSGYPAVRFEGFGGKWDQCKLGNVGTFRGGFGFPENEQGNIDGIAFYKVSDMNDGCNTLTMRKASNYVTSSQITKNKWKPILNQNIIFAKVGAAVYLERKRKAMGPFLLDNNMMAFQPKDANIDYIYYIFQRLRISKHAQVGTLPSLNASELRNIAIYIPNLNEQKVVADLMIDLDHTIILYDFKLELLKKLKSSLLQNMFI